MKNRHIPFKVHVINMIRGAKYAAFIILANLSSCTKVRAYVPVSGGQLVKIRPLYDDVDALQTENDRIRIQAAGSFVGAPWFVFIIENKTSQEIIFDTNHITGRLTQIDLLLPVTKCYKPAPDKLMRETSDFEIPCENNIPPRTAQKRYVSFANLPESFKSHGKPVPLHHIRLTTDAKSGIEINFLFKLAES